MADWISVKDKLPRTCQWVLVYAMDDDETQGHLFVARYFDCLTKELINMYRVLLKNNKSVKNFYALPDNTEFNKLLLCDMCCLNVEKRTNGIISCLEADLPGKSGLFYPVKAWMPLPDQPKGENK